MSVRLIIQPVMAALLAVRSGAKDAHEDRPPFLASIMWDNGRRKYFLAHGWKDVGKVFFMAAIIDTIYQILVFKRIYPLEVLVIAVTLSIIPYLIFRGPVNRLLRNLRRKESGTAGTD